MGRAVERREQQGPGRNVLGVGIERHQSDVAIGEFTAAAKRNRLGIPAVPYLVGVIDVGRDVGRETRIAPFLIRPGAGQAAVANGGRGAGAAIGRIETEAERNTSRATKRSRKRRARVDASCRTGFATIIGGRNVVDAMRRGNHGSRIDQRPGAQAQASAGLRGIGEEGDLLADPGDTRGKHLAAVGVIGAGRKRSRSGIDGIIGHDLEIGAFDRIDRHLILRCRGHGDERPRERGRGKQQSAAIRQSNKFHQASPLLICIGNLESGRSLSKD